MYPLKNWVKRFNPRQHFKQRLGLVIAATILCFSLLLSGIVGNSSKAQIKAYTGQLITQLAYQMSRDLDQDMFVYYQEIQTLATLDAIRDSSEPLANKRSLLNELQNAYKNYAWIGLTNPDGVVVASTNQILEGKNVSQRPWFIQGKQSPAVEDVHDAKLLASLLPNPNPNDEPIRFVDIATPVFSSTDQGKYEGVLGAHLYWQWAKQLRDNVLEPLQSHYNVEVMIFSESEEVLLGSASYTNKSQGSSSKLEHLKSIQLAQQGEIGSLVEQWLDGKYYLTGFAATKGHENYPGLGWIVIARQSTEEAFAKAVLLQQQIILWGIVVGITSGAITWWITGQLLNPLLEIAVAVYSIRQGDLTVQIPVFSGKDEVARLSRSVNSLFTNLEQQKRLLLVLNTKLDQKVRERTAKLDHLNQKLTEEVSDRKKAEVELQQANQELQRLTMVDGLTGVANRRHFDEHLAQEWRRSLREQLPLSLILLDADYFKRYNDFYGHLAGDHCLQQIAEALSSQVKRSHDLVARYGGEEFVVILPNTGIEGAVYIAETICQAIRALQIPHANSLISPCVTVSLGVVTVVPTPDSSPSALIESTDQQLYRAKEMGRDRVMFDLDDPKISPES